jgi:hypothetical protein
MLESIIIVIVSAIPILFYRFIDPNKDMERHFHKNDRPRYYLLQFAYSVLVLSFAFHSRFVVMKPLKYMYKLLVRWTNARR